VKLRRLSFRKDFSKEAAVRARLQRDFIHFTTHPIDV
jgi:hypothetical protein